METLRDGAVLRLCGARRVLGLPLTRRHREHVFAPVTGLYEREAARIARTLEKIGAIDIDKPKNRRLCLSMAERAAAAVLEVRLGGGGGDDDRPDPTARGSRDVAPEARRGGVPVRGRRPADSHGTTDGVPLAETNPGPSRRALSLASGESPGRGARGPPRAPRGTSRRRMGTTTRMNLPTGGTAAWGRIFRSPSPPSRGGFVG